MTTTQYAVWYASAGCLPDSEHPEMVGTLTECLAFIDNARAERDSDPEYDGTHDLYDWSCDEWYEPEHDADQRCEHGDCYGDHCRHK